jgi:hypothetical protein
LQGRKHFVPRGSTLVAFIVWAACSSLPTLGLQQEKAPIAAQKTPAATNGNQQGGVATGGIHAPVKDSASRPITAGGFVSGAPVVFVDETAKAGLTSFRHRSGTAEKKYILEVPGSGVALLDYDNDGWQDIYFVNGSTFETLKGKEKAPRAALFHNNHDGTFTDVSAKAGVANERWGFGVAIGDFDNDGWPDIYVSNFGKNRLYRNNHDGTFTDVADKAGVALGGWSTGVTFGDYDGDGKLDLFVAGYVAFDVAKAPAPGSGAVSYNYCQYRGQTVMCGPRGLKGECDHLFHNNGDGTFTDVSQRAGVSDPGEYYGFSAAFVDVNDDGHLDLIVANDSTPNYLYLNKGDGTFEDASYASGLAVNASGREQAAMGLAIGDYNNDGKVDVQTTNFSDDYNTLFKNEGDGNFTDVSFQSGIGEVTIPFLGWGAGFIDYNNDGLKDIFVVNGHVYPAVDKNDWGTTWAQRPLLFRNSGEKFELVPAAPGSGLALVIPARGAAFGDLFNDGQIDVVINSMDSPPTLLRNVSKGNNWLELKLVGGPNSPADAIGATAWLTADGVTQRVDIISGGSFISSSDMRPHFGLGKATRVEKLEIRWPSGSREVVPVSGINQILTVAEGRGIVKTKAK